MLIFAYTPREQRGKNTSQDMITTIGDLKGKATKDLNFEECVIFTDEFNNILMDDLDIIEVLYPFYLFEIRGIAPIIKATLP